MIRGLAFSTLWTYNAALIVALIYLLRKYRGDGLALFLIFLFWGGLFADCGKMVQNVFKIATLVYTFIIFFTHINKKAIPEGQTKVYIALAVYALYVLITGFLFHGDGIMLMMSQLSKYTVPVFLLPSFADIIEDPENRRYYNKFFGEIILVQIILNIWKLIVIGHWYEGLVGSVTGVAGGAVGTTLPLVGLCWLCSYMSLNISKKSLFFIIGLLFIGFMAGKRAVWLQFPVLFIVLSTVLNHTNFRNKLIPIILVSPILFYFGLRLSPTLNPENKVWGSFDPEYTLNYIMEYSGGTEKYSDDVVAGQGRLGANLLVFNLLSSSDDVSWKISGLGTKYIMAADSENYRDSNYYMGISNRGALTGLAKTFLAYGVVGLVLFLTFLLSVVFVIPNFKIRMIMGLMLLFDFVFYNSTMCSNVAIFTFFLFVALSLSYSTDAEECGYNDELILCDNESEKDTD